MALLQPNGRDSYEAAEHDAAPERATDEHRPPAQLGAVALLDGGVERVEVDVQDHAGTHSAHCCDIG